MDLLGSEHNFGILADVSKPATKRKQQAIATKNKIFESAIELIKARGFDNVTVDDICKKSGVTKGAFYHHFDSKESIIRMMYIDSDSYLMKKLPNILKNPNALDRITEILLTLAERVEYKGVQIIKQFIRENLDSSGIIDMLDTQNRPLVPMHIAIIAEGQENGEIRKDYEPEFIFWYINSAYNGILQNWCIQNGNYGFKEMLQKVLPIVLAPFKC